MDLRILTGITLLGFICITFPGGKLWCAFKFERVGYSIYKLLIYQRIYIIVQSVPRRLNNVLSYWCVDGNECATKIHLCFSAQICSVLFTKFEVNILFLNVYVSLLLLFCCCCFLFFDGVHFFYRIFEYLKILLNVWILVYIELFNHLKH